MYKPLRSYPFLALELSDMREILERSLGAVQEGDIPRF